MSQGSRQRSRNVSATWRFAGPSFTAAQRAPNDKQPHPGIDHHALEEFASSCRALDLSRAMKVPKDTKLA
jgi:hypothetical protein